MEARKEREQKFHDHAFSENLRSPSVSKFYSIVKSSREFYTKLVVRNCRGKNILEYGCGKGSYAFQLAKNGANVIGIDISEVAIKIAKEKAKDEGVVQKTNFLIMDAEKLTFPDNYFDTICGTGILHHLDLKRSLNEVVRVLKPEGKAFFIEPLGHNPAINFYRRLTPHLRTDDEHPLTMQDLDLITKYFSKVQTEFFYLFSLLAIPFKRFIIFSPTLNLLEVVDKTLFNSFPWLKKFGWFVVISLSGPKHYL